MSKEIDKSEVLDALIRSFEHLYEKLQKNKKEIRDIKEKLEKAL
jgi:hypothetical protein